MSQTTHTPGSWEISRDAVPPGHVQITVYADDGLGGKRVATVFESEANAHLVKAAPDMLAALESIAQDPYTTCACAEKARAAIAKAKGGA